MTYKTSDFFYNLPPSLIAQKPVKPRDHSRLLLLDKKTGKRQDKYFYNLIDHLSPGDVLILNNSKVFPARLIGKKEETGGEVEVFLHYPIKNCKSGDNVWECLIGGRVREGLVIDFVSKASQVVSLKATIIDNNQNGTWQVQFNLSNKEFWQEIEDIGEVPLPPYIKRTKQLESDKNNYQTIFADDNQVGSVAAPTAGLHFTKELLEKIQAKGIKIKYVTLHVGLGTFAPVKTENIKDHKMHSEFVTINTDVIKLILKAKKEKRKVIAVGTTSCRALESLNWSNVEKTGVALEQSFWTDIFIYPGYKFKVVDALITNFHLPNSSLMMLVSALAGKKNIEVAYRDAVVKKYRFFSYGDAMFIN